jgi:hypothetical protein
MENFDNGVIADIVEFLDGLALDIGLAGEPENIIEACPTKVTIDQFSDQADMRHERREFSNCSDIACLGISNESVECE